MTLLTGYLGLLTSIGTAANGYEDAAEAVAPGYGRQPASFSTPRNGISKLAQYYSFGFVPVGQIVGRGIWSRPTGGMLLMVLPYGNGARPQPAGGPVDAQDVGDITLSLTVFAGYQDGAAYSGSIGPGMATGEIAGTVYDAVDEGLAPWSQTPGAGGVVLKAIVTAPLILPGTVSFSLRVLNGALGTATLTQ